ncbi:SGNH/GDSL hydrolase family protein [Candidatus Microgenomates bacterium]|nr:SGNH/GDSL hydrolase family protein [Candidatus Microgenomates bacterium]
MTNSTRYLDKEFPALLSYKPDILVVESFAYNHWSGEIFNFDRQWLTIASIIDTIKKDSLETKIILGAAIAPNGQVFGDGKLNWPQDLKWNAATITKAYLQNLVNFATSEHYPLADAFHPSLDSAGNGLERYIDQSDHLHPSNEGKLLFSQKIVEAIVKNELIK